MSMNSLITPRRKLLRAGFSVGTLGLLGGCNLTDNDPVQTVLKAMSRWNDRVAAAIFDPNKLAPEFSEAEAAHPFRYNAWYGPELAPKLSASDYKLSIAGLAENKKPWTVEDLTAMPQVTQITRHVCVEGWSDIGKWTGTPLREFLKRIGADTTAKYVGFECADGYYEGLDMPTAMHPQTLMAFKLAGQTIPTQHGYPFKLRVPTKLGFKNPKFITTIFVTNQEPRGFWTDRGYNWFSGT